MAENGATGTAAAGPAEVGEWVAAAGEALGLFPSVIKSGEAWTSTCELVRSRAREAVVHLGATALAAVSTEAEPYLVWSNKHRAWWAPDCRGYTRHVHKAGRYDRAKALEISSTRGGGWPGEGNPYEIMVPERDALAMVERGR